MDRALVARFMHFYPQYRLADLRAMEPAEFQYLMAGMLDMLVPAATESREEAVNRQVREAHAKAMAKFGGGR